MRENSSVRCWAMRSRWSAAWARYFLRRNFMIMMQNTTTATPVVIPAEVEEEKTEEMRRIAGKIFRAVDGSGLARVDFFIDKKTGRVLFNELNTMPGFTPISMYRCSGCRQA